MLAGHYAPGLALKRLFPATPLWMLFLGVQAVDVGFFLLSFAGVEGARLSPEAPRLVVTSGVWTHSLVASLVWALAGGAAAGLATRSRTEARGVGIAVGLAVLSHWFADLIVHVPDLPLTLDPSTAVGLSFWLHPVWATLLEVGLVVGAYGWLRPSLPAETRPRADLVAGALVGLQLLNDFVIPSPPGIVGLGLSALGVYVSFTLLAWWVDRVTPVRDRAAA